jgi:hypothetical protein
MRKDLIPYLIPCDRILRNRLRISSSTFFNITPCSPLKFNRLLEEHVAFMALLAACFMLVSCLAYSSALKLEATWFSETLVEFQRTTCRYIPEDRILHSHGCENLKSYKVNNRSRSLNLPPILWAPEVHCRVLNSPMLVCVLMHKNSCRIWVSDSGGYEGVSFLGYNAV